MYSTEIILSELTRRSFEPPMSREGSNLTQIFILYIIALV